LNDYTLSPVFNIRGGNNISFITDYTIGGKMNIYTEESASGITSVVRQYIELDQGWLSNGKKLENGKGVVRFNLVEEPRSDTPKSVIDGNKVRPIGVKFMFAEGVLEELKRKEYCRGFFFVR